MGKMHRESKDFIDIFIWDMIFDNELLGKRETIGCTPYIVSSIFIFFIISLRSYLSNFIALQLKNILLILVLVTLIVPLLKMFKFKRKKLGIIDFIYILVRFLNSMVALFSGYGILFILAKKFEIFNLNDIIIQLIFYILGFYIIRITQNIIWGKYKSNVESEVN